jgi:tRNA(fMet)-specific endonuclease VapC
MTVAVQYMLDTNICIYALNQRPERVLRRIVDAGEGRVCISSITAAELAFGALKSTRPATCIHLKAFLQTLPALCWGGDAVWRYAQARLELEQAGRRIGERDLLIAAHALAENLTLVTHNTREFERIRGLKLENWAEEIG